MQIITTFNFLNGFAMIIELTSAEFNEIGSLIKSSPEVFYDEELSTTVIDFGLIKLPFDYFPWESFMDNNQQEYQFVILCKRVNDIPCRECFSFNLTKDLYLEAKAIEKTVKTFLKNKEKEETEVETIEKL